MSEDKIMKKSVQTAFYCRGNTNPPASHTEEQCPQVQRNTLCLSIQMHPAFHHTDPLPIHFLPPVETLLLFDQPSPENSNDLMNQYYLQFTDTRGQSDCSQASDRLEMLCPFPSSVIPH